MAAVVRVAVAIILFYVLVQVDDVSAQCVISPDLTTLTIANGLTRDVEFHCQCMDGNAMWLFFNRTSAPTQNLNIPPVVLLLAIPFDISNTGTYTCSPNNMRDDPSRDTITLSAAAPSGHQRICRIYSPSLTTNGGMIDIPNGTHNAILYCICMRNNVAVGPTIWSFNGAELMTQASGDNPYYRNNVPAPLIIPSFTATYVGTYGCRSLTNAPSVTIDLTLPVVEPPTNVRATVLTPRSVEVTWTVSSSSDVTGYLISYTTTAEYTSGGSVTVSGRSTTSHTLNNLEEGTFYTITVRANSNNRNVNSDPVSVTTYTDVPSSPPQNVMVTSVNSASLRVSWQLPSTINYNGPVTGHVIRYTGGGTSDMMNVNNGTTHTISGLVAFIDYSVTVAAINVNGTGAFSDAVVRRSGEDSPTPPRSLMVVDVTDTTVTLSWMPPDPPNGIITQYQIQYRGTNSSSFSNNQVTTDLTYTVTGLTTNTEYDFRVRAFTVVDRGPPSDIVTAFVSSLPPPTNVRSTVLTPRSVEVSWTVSTSPDVTGYLISYTTTAEYINISNRSRSVMVSGSTTSIILSNLEESTPYTIGVRATTNDGRRSGNIAVSVTTYTDVPSSPPQNVMVTSVNPASLRVSWQLPSTINYNGPITGHVIQYTGGGTSDMMNVNSTTTHTISGLVAFIDYSVIVAVRTVNGTGAFSNPVVGRSGEDIPSEPQSLETVSVNSISVTLQWSPPVNPNGIITQYSFQYNTTAVANTSNNVLIYTVNGLSPETVYVLQVRAYTSEGAGSPSIITIITSPGPVSDVAVHDESVTSSTLTLTWMEITLTNSMFSHYTVFYLPVRGLYGPIMASNRRKRQSAQAGELTMNFIGTTGNLTDLYGAVTYRIQVAVVATLNGQEIIGDRSAANEVDTLEGVPTVPRNLNVIVLTNNDVMLTWRRPDPPNGLITQYNASYINTNSQDSNTTTRQVDNGGGIMLSVIWTNLIQGSYQFSVVAFTRVGPGEFANLTQSITFKVSSDDGSDDNNGAVTALAILFAIAVIGLVISVVINVFLVVKLKQSGYDVNQSNITYSDIKQSRDNTITDSTNKHIKPPEPEYEAVDTKRNMKPDSDVKMDINPAYGCDVKMDANPAYQATS